VEIEIPMVVTLKCQTSVPATAMLAEVNPMRDASNKPSLKTSESKPPSEPIPIQGSGHMTSLLGRSEEETKEKPIEDHANVKSAPDFTKIERRDGHSGSEKRVKMTRQQAG
jgi:hypothetical protein